MQNRAKWSSVAEAHLLSPYNHCPETTTSDPFLSIYKCITGLRDKTTGPKSHSMLVTLLEI